jgi:hypothetical protein
MPTFLIFSRGLGHQEIANNPPIKMKLMKLMKSSAGFLSLLTLTFLSAGSINGNAQTQPANSLSITSYGASTSSGDNTAAIQACINAAQSQGKSVWIPAGKFNIESQLTATGITIGGAGQTSSIIYRIQQSSQSSSITATQLLLTSCTVQNLEITGNGTARGVLASYGINMKGTGWLVQNVTVSYSDAGMWMSGSNGTIKNCNLLYCWADGVNLNNAGGVGNNLTVENSTATGTTDDGFAINSQGANVGWQNMQSPQILNCTSQYNKAANGIRIAGSQNAVVSGNLVQYGNATSQNGIIVDAFSLGTSGYQVVNAQCKNNTLTHAEGTSGQASIYVDNNAQCSFSGNTLNIPSVRGLELANCNITFGPSNLIQGPAKQGIYIIPGATGSANFTDDTVENINSGQLAYQDAAGSGFTVTKSGNTGF